MTMSNHAKKKKTWMNVVDHCLFCSMPNFRMLFPCLLPFFPSFSIVFFFFFSTTEPSAKRSKPSSKSGAAEGRQDTIDQMREKVEQLRKMKESEMELRRKELELRKELKLQREQFQALLSLQLQNK